MTAHSKLGPRRLEAVRLIAMGHSQKIAASMMGVSIHTVAKHIELAMRHAGVRSNVMLCHWALSRGIVENCFEKERARE